MSADSQVTAIARSIADGPHRMTVGLRPLDVNEWIEDGPDFDEQLREKRRLLDGAATGVVAALDGTRDAQHEVLAMLAEHLVGRFPQRYVPEEGPHGERLRVQATGEAVPLDPAQALPIAAAGRLVPEDLCLMREATDGYRLVAAALCFPTRWRLADKLGKPMLAIHAPVPGYARSIGAASDRLMAALSPGRPLWRYNWSLLDSPVLHQPERVAPHDADGASDLGERLWLRSERQTLRRLPRSRDVLFTIRIRQCRLADLCRVAGTAARLLAQIDSMPDALKGYKRILEIEVPLREWLRRQARG